MDKLIISGSPHAHGEFNVRKIMWTVVIALVPTLLTSVYFFGLQALSLVLVAVASCLLFEYLVQRFLLKGPVTITDGSAIISGMLLAFNVPSNLPLGIMVIGAFVTIVIAKMSFGGLGKNPFNPALVGRAFLLISFAEPMTSWPRPVPLFGRGVLDTVTGPTPMGMMKEGLHQGMSMDQIMAQVPDYVEMLAGDRGGSLGEVSAIAIILGGLFLLMRRVISWHIPVAFIASAYAFSGILYLANPHLYANPTFHILAGGLLLGAVFMATDMATSPMSKAGMLIFGCGCGFLTILIRVFGSYPEGVSFAILIMNAFVPLINKGFKPKKYGATNKNFNIMAKKSSFKNMTTVLVVVAIIAAAAVSAVFILTKDTIGNQLDKKEAKALEAVLPAFDRAEKEEIQVDGGTITVFKTYNNENTLVGTAVNTFSMQGYSGEIRVLVGILPNHELSGATVLSQNETPGLGTQIAEEPFLAQFKGKNLDEFKLDVQKDGGDVDAISGATISTRAFCDAVLRAFNAVK